MRNRDFELRRQFVDAYIIVKQLRIDGDLLVLLGHGNAVRDLLRRMIRSPLMKNELLYLALLVFLEGGLDILFFNEVVCWTLGKQFQTVLSSRLAVQFVAFTRNCDFYLRRQFVDAYIIVKQLWIDGDRFVQGDLCQFIARIKQVSADIVDVVVAFESTMTPSCFFGSKPMNE